MIRSTSYADLNPAEAEELQGHIHNEFGHVPFVQGRKWAQPDWSFIKYEEGKIATFYNVVMREVDMDGKKYKVGGINNVITPKEFRGKGYATKVLKATESILFEDLNCTCGLLLCADALLPFYSRLGWYEVKAELYYDQPKGKELYDSNVMLLTPQGTPRLQPQLIDLNGLPW